MSPVGPVTPTGSHDQPADRRLATAARQLEGVFVEQLFKAMRATVPGDGALDGGAGEEMFTGLMDQHMSELVPQQWSSSLGEALLRQFHAAAGIAPAALDATAAERESPVPSAHRP